MAKKVKKTKKTRTKSQLKALVADDDMRLRKKLSELLRDEDFKVVCTGSLSESVNRLGNGGFDLIILDMVMPEKNGEDLEHDSGLIIARLLQRVLLTSGDAIVAVFTAFPSVKDCFSVSQVGAFYLPKSVPGVNMIGGLVEECTRLVKEKRLRKSKPTQTWLMQHYDNLVENFGGKTIAIVEASLAKKSRLKGGVVFGRRKIFTARSLEELKKRILNDPKLRRANPLIVDMKEE